VITELLSSPRLQSSLRKIDTEETSFSLYQQLVPPGGLRLRGGERESGRKIGRRRSTGSPEWREWLVARETLLLNEGERGEERRRGDGEKLYNKAIIYSEEESSTAPSSLSSSTSSTYSSSSCASDSEGEEGGFHPGRFGLEDGEMRSFQLDEEDYPDSVRVGGQEEEDKEEGENEGEEDFGGEGEKNFIPLYSSSPPPPPPSPTPFLLQTSLRLSPILRNRRSSLPQI